MQLPLAFGILLVFTALHGQGNDAVQACDQERLLLCAKTLWFASSKEPSEVVCSIFQEVISCLENGLPNCPEELQTQMAPVLAGSRDLYSLKCDDLANATKGDSCSDVVTCLNESQEMREEMMETLQEYRIGEIDDHLDSWCSHQTHCLDDNCDNGDIVAYVSFIERVLAKMCSERESFRDTSCYQGDFRQRMMGCEREGGGLYSDTVQEFKMCVNNALGELPGCSRDNFFFRFISFVADLLVQVHQ